MNFDYPAATGTGRAALAVIKIKAETAAGHLTQVASLKDALRDIADYAERLHAEIADEPARALTAPSFDAARVPVDAVIAGLREKLSR